MAFMTDSSYDLDLNAEMEPNDDPRRQVSRKAEHNPAAAGSPLNFGLGGGWRNLQNFAHDNPAAVTRLGAGIMSGDTAGRMPQPGQYAQAARDHQLNSQRRNRTLDFLRKYHPDLADMVEAGLPVAEAWQRLLAGWRPAERHVAPVDDGAYQPGQAEWVRRDYGSSAREPLGPTFHGDQPAPIGQMGPESSGAELPRQRDIEVRPVFGSEGGERLYQPLTQEAFDAMPSGAFYLDPGDGGVYHKP